MTHKLTGREVYDAVREQRQGHTGEYIAGFSTWIDRKVCLDALAPRLAPQHRGEHPGDQQRDAAGRLRHQAAGDRDLEIFAG